MILWREPLSVTVRWKVVEHYFTAALFDFQFYSVCNFVKFINFGLGFVRSERVNAAISTEMKKQTNKENKAEDLTISQRQKRMRKIAEDEERLQTGVLETHGCLLSQV